MTVLPAKGDEGVNSFLGNLQHKGGTIGVEQLWVSLLYFEMFMEESKV